MLENIPTNSEIELLLQNISHDVTVPEKLAEDPTHLNMTNGIPDENR